MKSLVSAIAASIFTIIAFEPSSPATTPSTVENRHPAARIAAAFKPQMVLAQLGPETADKQGSQDAAENENESGGANNADSSAGNDDQSNGNDAQNGDADGSADSDQNGDADSSADSDQTADDAPMAISPFRPSGDSADNQGDSSEQNSDSSLMR
jgi:hypothetical protein